MNIAHDPVTTPVEWADVSPEFGAGMPNGSCNAFVQPKLGVCGWPRRSDGSCLAGHPAPSGWPSPHNARA